MFKKILLLLLISILSVKKSLSIEQPPYQVSIWVRTLKINSSSQINEYGKHLCNGAIIHERLILTTALCMQNQTDKSKTILPQMLYVEAGNGNKILRKNISLVDIDKDFNQNTLQNDIAILHLNESFNLGERNDIKWIMLDDHNDYKKCMIQIYNPSLKNKSSLVQTHDVPILLNNNCTNTTIFKSPRTDDICSTYILDSEFCNSTNVENVGTDGGTALVCNSKLIALLSQIVPVQNRKNCTTNAIYTKITPHLNWFYQKIAVESVKDMGNPNHEMGTPYEASAPAHTITEMSTTKPSDYFDTTMISNNGTVMNTTDKPMNKNSTKLSGKNGSNSLSQHSFIIFFGSVLLAFFKLY